jgi:hypothetical protein
VDRPRLELLDLVLGDAERYPVALDPLGGADRDHDLALAPEMPVLEHEVGDVLLVVDEESLDVSQVSAVGRAHRAASAELDLALRDPVPDDRRVLVIRDRPQSGVDPAGRERPVIGQRVSLFDADLVVGILDGELADPEISGALHPLQLLDLLAAAGKVQGGVGLRMGRLCERDRDDPGEIVAVVRLDHQMRHPPRRRVDHDIGELQLDAVSAADRLAEL